MSVDSSSRASASVYFLTIDQLIEEQAGHDLGIKIGRFMGHDQLVIGHIPDLPNPRRVHDKEQRSGLVIGHGLFNRHNQGFVGITIITDQVFLFAAMMIKPQRLIHDDIGEDDYIKLPQRFWPPGQDITSLLFQAEQKTSVFGRMIHPEGG